MATHVGSCELIVSGAGSARGTLHFHGPLVFEPSFLKSLRKDKQATPFDK